MRSPLAFGKGFPSLAPRQGPARNSLRSPAVRSGQTVWPSWRGGAPAARALALAPEPAAQKGRTPNSQTQQPKFERLTAESELIAGFGCCPSAPPGLRPRRGCARERASCSDPGRLFDRSEQRERREFLPDPCLGRKPWNPLPKARGERSAGLIFWFLLDQAKRNSPAGARPGGLHRKPINPHHKPNSAATCPNRALSTA